MASLKPTAAPNTAPDAQAVDEQNAVIDRLERALADERQQTTSLREASDAIEQALGAWPTRL